MSSLERVALAIVGVALATTLVMSARQTAQVFTAAGNVFTSGLRTAMGR